MPHWAEPCVFHLRAAAGHRVMRLVLVFGLLSGLGSALGACSKCAVPTWPQSAWQQGAPQSCHSDSPQ